MSSSSLPPRPPAVSYARCAAADSDAINAQHAQNAGAAAAAGFDIPDSPAFRFTDNGVAAPPYGRCPALQQLIAQVTQGTAPFSRVYVKDPTRLGRYPDPRRHLELEALFEAHGVEIVYEATPAGRGRRLAAQVFSACHDVDAARPYKRRARTSPAHPAP